jgi:hypothetical protein
VAETPIATPSFAAWMRPKRKVYLGFFGGVCAGLVATAILFLRARLASFPGVESAWHQVEPFAGLHATLGMPITAQLVTVPIALAVSIALAILAFEFLVYRLGVDRGDHAWSSLAWTWRSWPMAVAWLPVSLLGMGLATLALDDNLLRAILGTAALLVVHLSLPLFAWNAACLVRPRARYFWRPRWPSWRAVGIMAATSVLPIAMLHASSFVIDAWVPALWALVPLVVYLLIALTAVAALTWISRGRVPVDAALRLSAARAPLAMVLQRVRLLVLVALACLWILPLALSLYWIAPQFEFALKDYGSLLPDAWMSVVHASRFVVKWWWLAAWPSMSALQLAYVWFDAAGTGRLFVERGWVGEEERQSGIAAPTPSTHPDSGPAATIPPTA